MEDEDFYVFGIDFGTTFSGVAWSWSGEPDFIDVITRWKSSISLTDDKAKAPTQIHYGSDGNTVTWGYGIPSDVEAISWFKLLLVDEEDLPHEFRIASPIRRARELVEQAGKEPLQVVADYLRLLWQHTLSDLKRSKGASALNGSPFKVWLTVPAIWDEDACDRMRQAARMAGIMDYRDAGTTQLELIAEPEAAALAALGDLKLRPSVKADDVYVVCDAGGGTVDLISYHMLKASPLVVQECVEGEGKMCGAVFIDRAFENFLQQKLGNKWQRLTVKSKKDMINKEWENGIKRLFNGEDKGWSVALPSEVFDQEDFKLGNTGSLPLKPGHINFWFDTVIQAIRGLLHKQVNAVTRRQGKPPKAILLVGGLGSCAYLHQKLEPEFERKSIDVLQPQGSKPWTAICRGAVIRGLNDYDVRTAMSSMVVRRVARASYGIAANVDYEDSVHDARDREWDPVEGLFVAKNQMNWYLKRGEDISENKPKGVQYTRKLRGPEDLPGNGFVVTVHTNNEEMPPARKTDTVRPLASIKVLLDTEYTNLPFWENNVGDRFRKIDFRVEMISTGTSLTWKAIVNDRVLGEEDVMVEQQYRRSVAS